MTDRRVLDDAVYIRKGLFVEETESTASPCLLGGKCTSCGALTFPRRPYCPECGVDSGIADQPLNRQGTIYSVTVARAAPVGFQAPYAFGYVDLPEGLRLFTSFTGCDPEELHIGMRVEVTTDVIRTDCHGRKLWGYKFRPCQRND